jgi:hypothetical protein
LEAWDHRFYSGAAGEDFQARQIVQQYSISQRNSLSGSIFNT